jgi:hypothetical protein
MQKWEYRQLTVEIATGRVEGTAGGFWGSEKPEEEILTELGEEGWELAGVSGGIEYRYLYFKRTKQEQ